jgi:hypothetical protein
MIYFLILTTPTGEQAKLDFYTLQQAESWRTIFMRTGDYSSAEILEQEQ